MKKRVIFCLFLSLYLLYTHKNFLIIKIEEFPYLSFTFNYLVDLFSSSPHQESSILKKEYSDLDAEKGILDLPQYHLKVIEAGYDFEEHKIMTEDGYILTAWRIPGRLDETNSVRLKRKPIILQHGLIDTSYTFLVLNSTECLSIMLADNGFDVWMTNSRGNLFSLGHTNPEYDSNIFYSKFWDFTFHEMAQYDLTANVFYVKNMTNFEKIDYIGHSQGTVQYFIQFTLNPHFIEENIDRFVALGTVVNIFNTTSTIVQLLEQTLIMNFLESIYVRNIFNMNSYMNKLVAFACKHLSFICQSIVQFFIEDYPTNRIDYKLLLENFNNLPGGTSARNINHWVQFYATKQFTYYDHGVEVNYLKYGQATPPAYDITKFKNYSVKSLMTISNADPFSKKEDCQHLFEHLNPDVFTILNLNNYNHLDYLWSSDASRELYTEIIDFLK